MAERKSFLLRIDSVLWQELEAWAQDELRSVNGQIEYILRQAVTRRLRSSKPSGESGGPDLSVEEEKEEEKGLDWTLL